MKTCIFQPDFTLITLPVLYLKLNDFLKLEGGAKYFCPPPTNCVVLCHALQLGLSAKIYKIQIAFK